MSVGSRWDVQLLAGGCLGSSRKHRSEMGSRLCAEGNERVWAEEFISSGEASAGLGGAGGWANHQV